MKKTTGIIALILFLLSFSPICVYGEATVIGTVNGSVGAQGTWEGDYSKEASRDSLVICFSGDAFGYRFEDVPAGVYKIAHYMNVKSMEYGKRIRISPKVSYGRTQIRCWVDWYTVDVIATVSDILEDDCGKIILVSVITIPEDGADIDVGFWQDTGAYVGTLDKVVLATADYDFKNAEYTLIGEKSYDADHVFNEDPEQKLLALEGSWMSSTMPTPAPKATPGIVPEKTPGTATENREEILPKDTFGFLDYLQAGLLIAIVLTTIFSVVGVVFLIQKKEK